MVVSGLRNSYPAVSKDLYGPLLELLTCARRAFGGDLDKFVIFTAIAVRTSEHQRYRQMSMDEVLAEGHAAYPSLGTNVRSISDSTGIARETVRRKVADLIEHGWVDRCGDDLSMTVQATQDLTEVREQLLSATARVYLTVARVEEQQHPQRGRGEPG